ncbi:Tetratricopeptide repeat protein 9A [Irineochytrium annulatum]|nr:Tetratricopeptide repeat protein 9A [Irineochytrium annulatum]
MTEIETATSSAAAAPPQMTILEKVQKGKDEKDAGNAAFKAGDIQVALRHYHTSILYLSGLDNAHLKTFVGGEDMQEEVKKDIKETILTCNSNMAACHMKKENWEKAIACCAKVLDKNPDNAKALFRRGKSNLELGNLDKAEADLKKACKLQPNDTGIRAELARIAEKHKALDEKQKKELFGMFDKGKK